ncbi:hypothetical protein KOR42_45280 [Thalassoglobus neptunius]|uniref:Uncharacterized protein n=1 Tax=Thalassoglobus neptunius TaxID=1938619 RepID=A0A5C5VWR9_9PLAN|nr:DUF6171 family protein [Thalassoglobus neptunius]TWT43068.1 hypothetical protein KOR42_45280 [Thalassoglobus neptunius]
MKSPTTGKKLEECSYRSVTRSSDIFFCRHTGVRATGGFVESTICANCTTKETPCETPREPMKKTLGGMGWDAARAIADFVSDGLSTVTKQVYEKRIAICQDCDRRQGNRCLECGCFLQLKARGRAFRCPLGKWEQISSKKDG